MLLISSASSLGFLVSFTFLCLAHSKSLITKTVDDNEAATVQRTGSKTLCLRAAARGGPENYCSKGYRLASGLPGSASSKAGRLSARLRLQVLDMRFFGEAAREHHLATRAICFLQTYLLAAQEIPQVFQRLSHFCPLIPSAPIHLIIQSAVSSCDTHPYRYSSWREKRDPRRDPVRLMRGGIYTWDVETS